MFMLLLKLFTTMDVVDYFNKDSDVELCVYIEYSLLLSKNFSK